MEKHMFVYYWLSQDSRRKADRKFYGKYRDPQRVPKAHPRSHSWWGTELGSGPGPSGPQSSALAFLPLGQHQPPRIIWGLLCNFLSLSDKLHVVNKDHLKEMHRRADWGESWKWGDTSQVSGWLECCGDLDAVWGDPATDPGQGNGAIAQL